MSGPPDRTLADHQRHSDQAGNPAGGEITMADPRIHLRKAKALLRKYDAMDEPSER